MTRVRPVPATGLAGRALLALALASLVLPAAARASSAVVQQTGGALGDAVVAGDVAYVAQGPAISVWQLDPAGVAAPVPVGTTATLPGLVQGLAASGPWLFAAWRSDLPNGALAVFSLADPLAPAHVLDFDYSASPLLSPGGLVRIGHTLLLADAEAGLHAIDVSDPIAPAVINVLSGSFGLQRLALSGPATLVGWGRSFLGTLFLEIFDVTSPASPVSVGFYSASNYFDAAVAGTLVVMVGDGLEVVDVADPANPAWQATVPGVSGRTVLFDGRWGYVGDQDGVHVWDFLDPTAPLAGTVLAAPADRTARAAWHASAAGAQGLLLTETGRALLIGLATPAAPTLEHAVGLAPADPTVAHERAGLLHVADFYSGLRVAELDFGDVGRYDTGIFQGAHEGLDVEGSVAYLAAWGFGLLTLDLADPAAPTLLGELPFDAATAVDVAGAWAYVVSSTGGGVLGVVDVADPADPILAGTLPLSKGLDVLYHDGLVLVADELAFDTGGLRIVDVSNPALPALVGHYTECSSAGGVDAVGDVAALACHDGSLHLVDLSNPAQPAQLGVWTDPIRFLTGHRARFDGDRLWYGNSEGIELLDVAVPAAPRRLASADLAFAVRGLELAGGAGSVWAATGPGGIVRVELVAFADGFESGDTLAWSATVP